MRECGLKHGAGARCAARNAVTPRAGVWIETARFFVHVALTM